MPVKISKRLVATIMSVGISALLVPLAWARVDAARAIRSANARWAAVPVPSRATSIELGEPFQGRQIQLSVCTITMPEGPLALRAVGDHALAIDTTRFSLSLLAPRRPLILSKSPLRVTELPNSLRSRIGELRIAAFLGSGTELQHTALVVRGSGATEFANGTFLNALLIADAQPLPWSTLWSHTLRDVELLSSLAIARSAYVAWAAPAFVCCDSQRAAILQPCIGWNPPQIDITIWSADGQIRHSMRLVSQDESQLLPLAQRLVASYLPNPEASPDLDSWDASIALHADPRD
jgi:hypothetical protein